MIQWLALALLLIASPASAQTVITGSLSIGCGSPSVFYLLWLCGDWDEQDGIRGTMTLHPEDNGGAAGMHLSPTIVLRPGVAYNALQTAAFSYPIFQIGAGATAQKSQNVLINGTPAGGVALRLDDAGAVEISGGPMSLGGALASSVQFIQRGTFGGNVAHQITTRLQPAVLGSQNAAALYVGPTIDRATTGWHQDFDSVQLAPPVLNGGAALVVNASTLDVLGAPVGATNNYALRVRAGLSSFGGPVAFPALANGYACILNGVLVSQVTPCGQ